MSPLVSVIIPMYNVEAFIGNCATTLFLQTMTDIEFIFVDDCSPDHSSDVIMRVLEQFPSRRDSVTLIKHDVNKGLPATRNTGLANARGKYIFHCDGDDYVELDMIESLYTQAEKEEADIVWCDYYENFKAKEIYKHEPKYKSAEKAVQAMLSRSMQYNVWNKLVKRDLYENCGIRFPDGFSMGEDLTIVKLFSIAKTVSYVPRAFYHYIRYNSTAMTQVYSQQKMDELHHNMEDLRRFLKHRFGEKYDKGLAYMELWAKFRYLLTDGRNNSYELWHNWFPESHRYIWSLPNANFRIKLLYWSASKQQWWIVWLHYWIILRGVYPVIYKHNSYA